MQVESMNDYEEEKSFNRGWNRLGEFLARLDCRGRRKYVGLPLSALTQL
jgi:hypothetical protein